MARVAVTGTASFLGGRILRRLVETRGADEVVAIDIASPPATLQGVRHRMVDLTLPGADRRLVDVFEEEGVDTVVHAAFFTTPRRDGAYAHELESIGTLHLAAAAAASGVKHLVLRSFTPVYGARGRNPNFLTEEHPSDAGSHLAWVRDKVEAEDHAFLSSRRHHTRGVSVLRFATLFGHENGDCRSTALRPSTRLPLRRRSSAALRSASSTAATASGRLAALEIRLPHLPMLLIGSRTCPPGSTRRRFVPRSSSFARRSARPEAEIPSTATIAAMPMAIPVAVSTARGTSTA